MKNTALIVEVDGVENPIVLVPQGKGFQVDQEDGIVTIESPSIIRARKKFGKAVESIRDSVGKAGGINDEEIDEAIAKVRKRK